MTLERLLRPASVAVVGASENQVRARTAVPALQRADVVLHLVNARRDTAFGQPCFPDLVSVPEPVDAVFSLVNAAASVQVVRDAAARGVGGVVVNADGFGTDGPGGSSLADEIVAAAGEQVTLLGPNCNGYIDAHRGLRMSGAPMLPLLAGPVGLISHSGGLLGAIGNAGYERGVGFSHLLSTGNELQTGLADFLDFLVADPATVAIALVVESVRRPEQFRAALLRAHAAGKPVVALKLGRSARGQAIARSHTGAITGSAWVYDVMFAQHGVGVAHDVPDLVDQLVCFAQLPRDRWSRAEGVAVLATSGGWAGIAGDVAEDEGVPLPDLDQARAEVLAVVPEAHVVNPLDMSGRIVSDREQVGRVAEAVAADPQVDTLVSLWFLDDAGLDMGSALIESTVEAAARHGLPALMCSIDDGRPGEAARELPARGVALGRGVRSGMRAIRAMGQHVRDRDAPLGRSASTRPTRGAPGKTVATDVGPILRFADAMKLVESTGITVAPYTVLTDPVDVTGVLVGHTRFVVKLADVPHRTDIGAVRLGIDRDGIAAAVADLQQLADRLDLPRDVVVQAQLPIDGEAILGIDTTSPLGPFVAFGAGGTLVELGAAPAGAFAPVDPVRAARVVSTIGAGSFLDGIRGAPPWDRDLAAQAVADLSTLADAGASWLASLEINPLALVEGRLVAVDCLAVVRPADPAAGDGPRG